MEPLPHFAGIQSDLLPRLIKARFELERIYFIAPPEERDVIVDAGCAILDAINLINTLLDL